MAQLANFDFKYRPAIANHNTDLSRLPQETGSTQQAQAEIASVELEPTIHPGDY